MTVIVVISIFITLCTCTVLMWVRDVVRDFEIQRSLSIQRRRVIVQQQQQQQQQQGRVRLQVRDMILRQLQVGYSLHIHDIVLCVHVHDVYMCVHADSLTLEKVHVMGPPPPARLDHAMCAVYLPTVSTTSTNAKESISHPNAAGRLQMLL